MKIPYHCPYCDQVSMRKWNLSTHMRRKHKGLDNPFDMAKETVLTDSVYQSRNNNKYESFWPQFNPSNPFEPIEKLVKFKNLKEELKQSVKWSFTTYYLKYLTYYSQNDSWSIYDWK